MDNNDFEPGQTPHESHESPARLEDLPPGQGRHETQANSAWGIRDVITAEADAHPELDAGQVASRVVVAIAGDWRRMVFPMVAEAVEWHRRRGVKAAEKPVAAVVLEREASKKRRPVTVTMGDSADDLMLFLPILEKRVSTYRGGPQVAWGDMTVVQHRLRAERLDVNIAGTVATRDLHLAAATACEARGADTLRMALKVAA